MCYYDQHVFSCGDWVWGQFRQHCDNWNRTGEVCSTKLVMQALPVDEKCRSCDATDTMRRHIHVEKERLANRLRYTPGNPLVQKTQDLIEELEKQIATLRGENLSENVEKMELFLSQLRDTHDIVDPHDIIYVHGIKSGRLFDPEFIQDEESDGSSVGSDQESIFSHASSASTQTSATYSDSIDELVLHLTREPRVVSTFALQPFVGNKARLERGFRRMLRRYARDLKDSASSRYEKLAVHLVVSRIPYISSKVISHFLDVKQVGYLPYAPILDERDEVDEVAPTEDDVLEVDAFEDAAFALVKDFLFEGVAYEQFLDHLAVELMRTTWLDQLPAPNHLEDAATGPTDPCMGKDSLGLSVLQRLINSCTNYFDPILEQYNHPIALGRRRLRWTCGCGRRMFDDFIELKDGALDELERALNDPKSYSGSNQKGKETAKSPWSLGVSSDTSESTRATRPWRDVEAQETKDQLKNSTSGEDNETSSSQATSEYFLVCLPHKILATRVGHIDARNILSDQAFFRVVRQTYLELRRSLWSFFSLMAIAEIRFVKFEMYRSLLAEIRQLDDLPPETEKSIYAYEPSPPEYLPPIGSNMLVHLCSHPEEADCGNVHLNRIPKKLRDRLTACPIKGYSHGWGLQIIERVSKTRVCLIGQVGILISTLVGVVWAAKRHDVQSGFAVAAYIMMAFALAIGSLQAASEH